MKRSKRPQGMQLKDVPNWLACEGLGSILTPMDVRPYADRYVAATEVRFTPRIGDDFVVFARRGDVTVVPISHRMRNVLRSHRSPIIRAWGNRLSIKCSTCG